jgi:AcrR family transcriptional regulator
VSRTDQEVAPASTGDALLDAAEACFAQWGVAKTSMGDVAKRAGLSRPTLYRYFADRDALSVAVTMRRSERLMVRAERYLARFDDLDAQLLEGLLFLIDHGRQDRIVIELLAGGDSGGAERLVRSETAHRLSRRIWEPVLERARDRGELRADLDTKAAMSWLIHVQATFIATLGPEPTDAQWDETRTLLRDFALPGFLARPL